MGFLFTEGGAEFSRRTCGPEFLQVQRRPIARSTPRPSPMELLTPAGLLPPTHRAEVWGAGWKLQSQTWSARTADSLLQARDTRLSTKEGAGPYLIVTDLFEWGPNKGPPAWGPWSQQKENAFTSKAKEGFSSFIKQVRPRSTHSRAHRSQHAALWRSCRWGGERAEFSRGWRYSRSRSEYPRALHTARRCVHLELGCRALRFCIWPA